MSIIAILGWFILGAVVVGAITIFWDEIKNWLNNTAADAVEKVLGYTARQRMYRAVARIDKYMNVIRNRTIVYTKKHELDNIFDKVTLSADASPYEIDSEVLNEIRNKGELVQEFGYRV